MPPAAEFPPRPEAPLRVGISECLLGAPVRYDGSAASTALPHSQLDGLYRFQGRCPEVAIGLGAPRPPIRLVAGDRIRALGVNDADRDVTDALQAFAVETAQQLEDVAGYILMQNSPSCGLQRVKLYPLVDGLVAGPAVRSGRGIFAAKLAQVLPQLPLEEAGRLHDSQLRHSFVIRTFAYAHWQALRSSALNRDGLIEFHQRYRCLLLAHSIRHDQQIGRLLADPKQVFERQAVAYLGLLMAGLSIPASRAGHALVLGHLQSRLGEDLDADQRRELAQRVCAYRSGTEPLEVPLAWLKHQLITQPGRYRYYQTYLEPCPGGS